MDFAEIIYDLILLSYDDLFSTKKNILRPFFFLRRFQVDYQIGKGILIFLIVIASFGCEKACDFMS